MSFFAKPVAEVTFDDLDQLRAARATENLRLEFKSEMPDGAKLVKQITAMANAYGGRIIVGAREHATEWYLEALPGVPRQNSLDAQVNSWCALQTHPPISCVVSPPISHPQDAGRFFYVIEVPASMDAPHFLNGRRGAWIRHGEGGVRIDAAMATYDELVGLGRRRDEARLRRRALEEAATKTVDEFVRVRFSPLIVPTLQVFASPEFPSRRFCSEFDLFGLLPRCGVRWRSQTFPGPQGQQYTSPDLVTIDSPARAEGILEFSTWGSVSFAVSCAGDSASGASVNLPSMAGHLCLFARFARSVWRQLGVAGSVRFVVRCRSVAGLPVRWGPFDSQTPVQVAYFKQGPEYEVVFGDVGASDDGEEMEDVLLRRLAFAINASDLAPSMKERGYAYAMWSR